MNDDNKLWLPPSMGRRRFILGPGAVAFLAACGGDDDVASPIVSP